MQTTAQGRTDGPHRIRNRRAWQAGAVVGGLALIGAAVGSVGLGAAGAGPKMQVLPSPTGLKYGQTVEVKAQNLPKGSGSTALTICGITDASGKRIATPTADDCVGAAELNSGLVKLQQWTDGSFDQQYTLPKSGQQFGKNKHACDATHLCALVVADANPSNPAYYVPTEIQFVDQKPATPTTVKAKKPTPTTKPTKKAKPAPKPVAVAPTTVPPTTTTTTAPLLAVNVGGGGTAGQNGGGASLNVSVAVNAPNGGTPSLPGLPSGPPANPIPPQAAAAINQACAELAQAAEQGGVDTTALMTACSTLVNGGGGAELATILQSPSLGCFAASSLTQNNAQLADACSQLATALQPYSSQLGTALAPVFGLLP